MSGQAPSATGTAEDASPSGTTRARRLAAAGVAVLAVVFCVAGAVRDDMNCDTTTVSEESTSHTGSATKDTDTTKVVTPADPAASTSDRSVGIERTVTAPGTSSKTSTTRTCAGVDLPALIPFGLLVAILLGPEITEFSIPGVFQLKREVKAQASKIERQDGRQADLERALQSVHLQLQTQVLTQTNQSVKVVVLNGMTNDLEQKHAQLIDGEDIPTIELRAPAPDDDTRYALAVNRLLGFAEQIRNARLPGAIDQGLSAEALTKLHRWRNLFREEIDIVLTVRNSVVHGQRPASADDLEEVCGIAERLVDYLNETTGLG